MINQNTSASQHTRAQAFEVYDSLCTHLVSLVDTMLPSKEGSTCWYTAEEAEFCRCDAQLTALPLQDEHPYFKRCMAVKAAHQWTSTTRDLWMVYTLQMLWDIQLELGDKLAVA